MQLTQILNNHIKREVRNSEASKTDATKNKTPHFTKRNAIISERNFYIAVPEPTVVKNFSISRHVKYYCNSEYFPVDILLMFDKKFIETTAFLEPFSVELQIEQRY